MNIEMLGKLLSVSPVLLVGEAGFYKTRMAIDYAKNSCLEYEIISMTGDKMTSDIIGFVDLAGNSIPTTKIFDIVENGGVLILDEISLANPSILASLNLLLGSKILTLGSKMIKAHKDFKVIATANSINGDKKFITNMKMDYAFIDRFFVYQVHEKLYYDTEEPNKLLEKEITELNKILIDSGYYDVDPSMRQCSRALEIRRKIGDNELVIKALLDPFTKYGKELYIKIANISKKNTSDLNRELNFDELNKTDQPNKNFATQQLAIDTKTKHQD